MPIKFLIIRMGIVFYKYKRWLSKKPVYTFEQASETYSVFRFLSYVAIYWIFPYPICYGYVLTTKDKSVKITPALFRKLKQNLLTSEDVSNYIKNAPDIQTEKMYPFLGLYGFWDFLTTKNLASTLQMILLNKKGKYLIIWFTYLQQY